MPVQTLDDVQTKTVKASLSRPSPSIAWTTVVKDALERHYGSLKAAAISLQIDQSQLSRELKSGDFKLEKLERADPDAQRFIANAVYEAFGDTDPKAQAKRLIREARRTLDELADVV